MLLAKLSFVDTIQPQSNKFATGVGKEATHDSKLNDSPENCRCHQRIVVLYVQDGV